jgi:hypothetical protein
VTQVVDVSLVSGPLDLLELILSSLDAVDGALDLVFELLEVIKRDGATSLAKGV